eukprot:TRINITY_DN4155_c0_g1_i4.p1 TRINITY_DN4155_c0_g1~~TRINITY_DN4155_c0_g1_i4.p1  ORF type:complete len:560 (+),score=164.80 TRINITY_DN4155_c0_g1_i4:70-1749(+)
MQTRHEVRHALMWPNAATWEALGRRRGYRLVVGLRDELNGQRLVPDCAATVVEGVARAGNAAVTLKLLQVVAATEGEVMSYTAVALAATEGKHVVQEAFVAGLGAAFPKYTQKFPPWLRELGYGFWAHLPLHDSAAPSVKPSVTLCTDAMETISPKHAMAGVRDCLQALAPAPAAATPAPPSPAVAPLFATPLGAAAAPCAPTPVPSGEAQPVTPRGQIAAAAPATPSPLRPAAGDAETRQAKRELLAELGTLYIQRAEVLVDGLRSLSEPEAAKLRAQLEPGPGESPLTGSAQWAQLEPGPGESPLTGSAQWVEYPRYSKKWIPVCVVDVVGGDDVVIGRRLRGTAGSTPAGGVGSPTRSVALDGTNDLAEDLGRWGEIAMVVHKDGASQTVPTGDLAPSETDPGTLSAHERVRFTSSYLEARNAYQSYGKAGAVNRPLPGFLATEGAFAGLGVGVATQRSRHEVVQGEYWSVDFPGQEAIEVPSNALEVVPPRVQEFVIAFLAMLHGWQEAGDFLWRRMVTSNAIDFKQRGLIRKELPHRVPQYADILAMLDAKDEI